MAGRGAGTLPVSPAFKERSQLCHLLHRRGPETRFRGVPVSGHCAHPDGRFGRHDALFPLRCSKRSDTPARMAKAPVPQPALARPMPTSHPHLHLLVLTFQARPAPAPAGKAKEGTLEFRAPWRFSTLIITHSPSQFSQ